MDALRDDTKETDFLISPNFEDVFFHREDSCECTSHRCSRKTISKSQPNLFIV